MNRLIDADALEKDGWMMYRIVQVDEKTMSYQTKKPTDFPTIEPEQRWVPCNERLPEDDRTKIVTLANGNAECGYYSNGDWWCIGDSINLENPIVIAWMRLPEPWECGADMRKEEMSE